MELTISKSSLQLALQGLSRVIDRKNSLPVLSAVLIDVDDSGARLTATDLDQVAVFTAETHGYTQPGRVVIPASDLKELIRSTKSPITLRGNSEALTAEIDVAGQQIERTLTTIDPDEWPALPPAVHTRPAQGFHARYKALAPFASTDSTRQVLNAVYVDCEGKGKDAAAMVATDGRRLTRYNSMSLPITGSLVLPVTRFLLGKLPDEADIGLRTDDGTTWFGLSAGPWRYQVRCFDGTYPNYRQVIPSQTGGNTITFGDEDVALLLQLLPTMKGADSIALVGDRDQISVIGQTSPEDASTRLTLEHSTFEGEKSFIGVSRDYLSDALKTGFRRFSYEDENSPLLSQDGDSGTHVLMPVRIPEPEHVADSTAPETKTEHKAATPTSTRKEKKMPKETQPTPTALDRVNVSIETAKVKVREASQSLTEVGALVRELTRDQKSQTKEVDAARAALTKLQGITL